MRPDVTFTDDPAAVIERAGAFLAAEPCLHNLILTLLHARRVHPISGRYWVASRAGRPAGVVFQSPLDFPATISLMEAEVVEAMVDAIAAAGVTLPGVNGEAGAAARFAGCWTERARTGAAPARGQRIYEVDVVATGTPAPGRFRKAVAADRDLLVTWTGAFQAEIGEAADDPARAVDERLPAGSFWLWDDGGPVSLACRSAPVFGVVRIQMVFTPPPSRLHGYGRACVGEVSTRIRAEGNRCMLYADLANPVANALYRDLGYRAVAEALRYDFAASARG
jgi:GNAT superfamily N-acetyltransferase